MSSTTQQRIAKRPSFTLNSSKEYNKEHVQFVGSRARQFYAGETGLWRKLPGTSKHGVTLLEFVPSPSNKDRNNNAITLQKQFLQPTFEANVTPLSQLECGLCARSYPRHSFSTNVLRSSVSKLREYWNQANLPGGYHSLQTRSEITSSLQAGGRITNSSLHLDTRKPSLQTGCGGKSSLRVDSGTKSTSSKFKFVRAYDELPVCSFCSQFFPIQRYFDHVRESLPQATFHPAQAKKSNVGEDDEIAKKPLKIRFRSNLNNLVNELEELHNRATQLEWASLGHGKGTYKNGLKMKTKVGRVAKQRNRCTGNTLNRMNSEATNKRAGSPKLDSSVENSIIDGEEIEKSHKGDLLRQPKQVKRRRRRFRKKKGKAITKSKHRKSRSFAKSKTSRILEAGTISQPPVYSMSQELKAKVRQLRIHYERHTSTQYGVQEDRAVVPTRPAAKRNLFQTFQRTNRSLLLNNS